jgi:hypothetical protein
VDLFALLPVTLRRTWHHQNRKGRGRLNDDQFANPVSPTASPMINVLKVDRFGLQQNFMILKPITAASGKKAVLLPVASVGLFKC